MSAAETHHNTFRFRYLSFEAKKMYRKMEASVLRLDRLKNQKRFLFNCRDEKVIPHTLTIPLKMDAGPFPDVYTLILKDRIEFCKQEIEQAAMTKRQDYNNLKYYVDRDLLKNMSDFAHDLSRSKRGHHQRSLDRKIINLCNNSVWNQFSNPENTVNISSHTLSEHESTVLGLGLSFNLEPVKNDTLNLLSTMEKYIFRHKNLISEPDFFRGLVSPIAQSFKNEIHLLPKRFQTAFEDLCNNRSIKILPADKGGKTVVLNTDQYLEKAFDILSDDITYEKLNKNPIKTLNANIRREIKRNLSDVDLQNRFLRDNCSLPYFYGLPKIHKEGYPLRPVISNVGAATRPLAGWLAEILSKSLGTFSCAHLKNNFDFKNKLNEFARENSISSLRMVSFDIKALYTNVPTDEVLRFIESKIDENKIEIPVPKNNFMNLIRLCINNNNFEFENNFYRQKFGIAMGSPLSPVLANLYMEFFESTLLPTLAVQPKLWLRYVDDIFALIDLDMDHNDVLNNLNILSPTIKFTCELEVDGKLPFLDCLVVNHSSCFRFDIYRKPTYAGSHLHYFSWHPESVKRSVIFSFMLRAYRICDHIYLDNEINKLYAIFKKLGYPKHFVDKVHRDVRRKHFASETTVDSVTNEHSGKAHISVPYNAYTKSIIKPILAKSNCTLHYKASNTLRSNLVKTKPKLVNDDVGVYSIPCQDCNKSYIGQTGRSVSERIKEHKYALRSNNFSNALAQHSFDGHAIGWADAHLLFKSRDREKRLIIESLVIDIVPNFNNTKGTHSVDKPTKELILNDLPKLKDKILPNS